MNKVFERTQYYLIKHERQLLVFAFVLTIILRTVHVVIIYKTYGTTKWEDDKEYYSMGSQIATGNWAPMLNNEQHMQVGPLLPLLIALFIKMFGNPNMPLFVYNVLITSLLVPLLYFFGKEIFNRNVGLLLAIWGIFYMDFYKYNPNLLKEPTVFFFLPLTLFLLFRSNRNKKLLIYLIFSAFSFAWLIHADERFFFYFPIFLLVFFLKQPFKITKVIRSSVIWITCVILFILPWSIHNYKIFGQVVLISPRTTALTSKVWGNDISGVGFKNKEPSTNYNKELFIYNTEKYYEKFKVIPHEFKGPEIYIRAFLNYWQPTYFKVTFLQHGARLVKWSWLHNTLSIMFYGVFLPFYFIGLVLLALEFNPAGLFLGIIPIIHSLIHTYMIMPLERYRSPCVFIIVMIAFYAIIIIYSKVKMKL
jgi:4-amino-4-deoxy-L-arabinose transferase-like glycosyltransferase